MNRFPNDENTRKTWIDAIPINDFTPGSNAYICSNHFESKWLNVQTFKTFLKKNAVPTVFSSNTTVCNVPRKNLVPHRLPDANSTTSISSSAAHSTIASTSHSVLFSAPANTDKLINFTSACSSAELNCPSTSAISLPSSEFIPSVECMQLLDNYESSVRSLDTPRKVKLKQKITIQKRSAITAKKKIRFIRKTNRHLKKTVLSVKELISELRKKTMVTDEVGSMLSSCSESAKQLFKGTAKPSCNNYSKELRAFALTLNFYSPKAYNYVRSTFGNSLPHPKTLQRWYQSVDGSPGFTKEAFAYMKKLTNDGNQKIHAALLMDEMAIRQHTQYFNNKLYGYVDHGAGISDDSMPLAKEALVFMVIPFCHS